MAKQLCEIDIPDGYEFVQDDARIIIRKVWQPPEWLKPGWIAMYPSGCWSWFEQEPHIMEDVWGYGWSAASGTGCYYLSPKALNFDPPPCDDWRQSKRRIGGDSQ